MKRIFTFIAALAMVIVCITLLPTEAQAEQFTDGTFVYQTMSYGVSIIRCDKNVSGDVVIPEYADIGTKMYYVTGISDTAFDGCDKITSITIPRKMSSISGDAFKDCTKLSGIWAGQDNPYFHTDSNGVLYNEDMTEIVRFPAAYSGTYYIPDTITTIGEGAFSGCVWLENVELPSSVVCIEFGAFYECTRLNAIDIPDSVTTIGGWAFYNCNLYEIDIPDGVTIIDDGVFAGCPFTEITLGNNVTEIRDYAFAGCGIKNIMLPDSISYIGKNAFEGSGLKSINIPDGISTIESETFRDCRLENISIPTSVIEIALGAFAYAEVDNVHYAGSKNQWNTISVGAYNDGLSDTTLHFAINCNNGHTWSNGEVTKEPTCKEEGSKTYTCSVCKETKTEAIAKLTSHSWNAGVVTKKATCKETGVKTYTCTACNATKTETIAKTTTHSWNVGVVTKKATCKETGVKTYTCTACNATKTETIAKTTTHSYGNGTKVNDTTHKHTCSVCSKEETANHSWNGGSVTKKATCKEAGVKTYTCTACNATKTESIAKLTTHTYDHACDTDCNVCGATRTTTHNYKTSWSKDKTNHWHECSVCGDKKDVAAHTPGAEATETTVQTCTTCGYVIKAALGHTHKYASTWTTDENGHWYACSGCEEKGSYAAHDFENACDKDCSICGYTRETEHKFAETWSSDANNHWHECTGCGLKQDEAAHEPGEEATATTAQTCTICGYEITPALGVEETEPTTPVAPTEPAGNDETSADPTALIAVIAVVVLGGAVTGVIIWKKKH